MRPRHEGRIIRRLVVVLAMAAALLPLGARPVTAHLDGCVGTGLMTTGSPVYYSGFGPTATTSFYMSLDVWGGCASLTQLQMYGTITGPCLTMTGEGETTSGHEFSFAVAGPAIAFTGEVRGAGDIQANAFLGEDCLTGATGLFVTLGVLLIDSPPPNTPPSTPTLVAPADGASFATTDIPVFTVNAADAQGGSYTATIELQQVGSTTTRVLTTPPASSGSNASTTSGNLAPGDYEWRARASDLAATGGWSGFNTFTVTLT